LPWACWREVLGSGADDGTGTAGECPQPTLVAKASPEEKGAEGHHVGREPDGKGR